MLLSLFLKLKDVSLSLKHASLTILYNIRITWHGSLVVMYICFIVISVRTYPGSLLLGCRELFAVGAFVPDYSRTY